MQHVEPFEARIRRRSGGKQVSVDEATERARRERDGGQLRAQLGADTRGFARGEEDARRISS
jgi:hypothetical protein